MATRLLCCRHQDLLFAPDRLLPARSACKRPLLQEAQGRGLEQEGTWDGHSSLYNHFFYTSTFTFTSTHSHEAICPGPTKTPPTDLNGHGASYIRWLGIVTYSSANIPYESGIVN
jgi:hypothetical protein